MWLIFYYWLLSALHLELLVHHVWHLSKTLLVLREKILLRIT